MANVQVIQRNAHLAGAVKLEFVNGRDGRLAKAVLTAISNTRRASRADAGESRVDESTAIQWTLWGKQAENAAEYLGKGSHVNIVGRLRNNNYTDSEGQDIFALAFTAEELDYLDTKAEGDALRAKRGTAAEGGDSAPAAQPAAHPSASPPSRSRKGAAKAPAAEETDDIPF